MALISQTLQAQPKNIPIGQRATIGGAKLQCYTLPEFTKVLKADADLTACTSKEILLKKKIANLEKQIVAYAEISEAFNSSVTILKEENDRLFKLWKQENKDRHIAENKPRWGSALSWGAAGTMTLVSAILLGIVLLD